MIVSFARHLMERVIVFDVTSTRYRVLARASARPGEDSVSEVSGSPEDLILLGVIAQTQQPAYGPTPSGEMYDKFFDTLGLMRPPFILLYPLSVAKKTRAVLFGGLGAMRPPQEFADLQMLFKEASTALEMLSQP